MNQLSLSGKLYRAGLALLLLFGSYLASVASPLAPQAANPAGILFRSTDSGATWARLSDGLNCQWVAAVAVDTSDPNVIYAGTDRGVFKSLDAGAHWIQPNGLISTLHITSIKVSPLNNGLIYVTSWESRDLLRSNDAGDTWNFVPLGKYKGRRRTAERIVIDPADPAILYVQSPEAVFKSTNNGKTWTPVLDLPSTAPADYPRDLQLVPNDPSTLYAVGSNRIYRTTDGGNNWTDLTGRVRTTAQQRFNDTFTTVTVNPFDPSAVYVSGQGWLYKSTDKGESWLSTDDPNYIYHTAVVSAFPSGLLGTSHEHVFSSVDGGTTWLLSQFPKAEFLDLIISPMNTSVIYAGASSPLIATPWIYGTDIKDGRLLVGGVNFDDGAVILLDGVEQATVKDKKFPGSQLIAKKAGAIVRLNPGAKIQVRNADGQVTQEVTLLPHIK